MKRVSVPALVCTGILSVAANQTSTIAVLSGQMTTTWWQLVCSSCSLRIDSDFCRTLRAVLPGRPTMAEVGSRSDRRADKRNALR